MITIENIDLELPQIGREPNMGYTDEYIEYTMLSGKVRRKYKGKRFYATFSYAFFTDTQIATIKSLLDTQRQQGYLNAIIKNSFGTFSGQIIMELNGDQKRFKIDRETGEATWLNWKLAVKAVDLQ